MVPLEIDWPRLLFAGIIIGVLAKCWEQVGHVLKKERALSRGDEANIIAWTRTIFFHGMLLLGIMHFLVQAAAAGGQQPLITSLVIVGGVVIVEAIQQIVTALFKQ